MREIRKIRYDEILDAPNAKEIEDEYATECMLPDYNPQRETYRILSENGVLHCFGAFEEDELVGFVSVLIGQSPHNGKLIATIESIFVQSKHRSGGSGDALMDEVEQLSDHFGCSALINSPRIGSRLDKVLSRRKRYAATHIVYTRFA